MDDALWPEFSNTVPALSMFEPCEDCGELRNECWCNDTDIEFDPADFPSPDLSLFYPDPEPPTENEPVLVPVGCKYCSVCRTFVCTTDHTTKPSEPDAAKTKRVYNKKSAPSKTVQPKRPAAKPVSDKKPRKTRKRKTVVYTIEKGRITSVQPSEREVVG